MFSQGLISLKKAASTETRLMNRRTWAASPTTSQPKTRAVPVSGTVRVARIRIRVDFPLPLGPITPVMAPVATVRSSAARATLSDTGFCQGRRAPVRRNRLLIPRISIAGPFICLASWIAIFVPLLW